METVIWMLGFLAVLAILVGMADERSSFLFASFKSGAQLWSQIFPLVALITFYYCIITNLIPGNWPFKKSLQLMPIFSKVELAAFLIIGSTLLTRISNLIGIILSFYCIQRMFFTPVLYGEFSASVAIFVSSVVTVAAMADCLPWVEDRQLKVLGDKLREIVILIFSFVIMAALFACFLKINEFTKWLGSLDASILGQTRLVLLAMMFLFAGWVAVAIGVARHIFIPIVSLPTILAVSFLTKWSPTTLCVFFVALLFVSMVRRKYLIYSTTRVTYI